MNIRNKKIFLPVLILMVVGILLTVYFFYFVKPNGYFAVVGGEIRLSQGDPVFLENIVAGRVEEIISREVSEGHHVVRFSLTGDYSIPTNSSVKIIYPAENENGYIRIIVQASKNYYQPGDTVFRGKPEVAKEVNSSADKSRGGNNYKVLIYKVQLMASSKKISLDSKGFRGIEGIEEELSDGVYKYYTGKLERIEEAKELREEIVNMGIADAFIVPFLDGQRISIDEALSYEK